MATRALAYPPDYEPPSGNGVKRVFLALSRAQTVALLLGIFCALAGSWFVSLWRITALENSVQAMLIKADGYGERLVKVEMYLFGPTKPPPPPDGR